MERNRPAGEAVAGGFGVARVGELATDPVFLRELLFRLFFAHANLVLDARAEKPRGASAAGLGLGVVGNDALDVRGSAVGLRVRARGARPAREVRGDGIAPRAPWTAADGRLEERAR